MSGLNRMPSLSLSAGIDLRATQSSTYPKTAASRITGRGKATRKGCSEMYGRSSCLLGAVFAGVLLSLGIAAWSSLANPTVIQALTPTRQQVTLTGILFEGFTLPSASSTLAPNWKATFFNLGDGKGHVFAELLINDDNIYAHLGDKIGRWVIVVGGL